MGQKILLLLIFCILLFSCSGKEDQILLLITDQSEVVLLAEYFNSRHEDMKIMVQFEKEITPEEMSRSNNDMIISRDIQNDKYIEDLQKLNYNGESITALYPSLIRADSKGRIQLIPLSFDLPIILYRQNQFEEFSAPFMLSSSDLERLSSQSDTEKRLTHMAFSPLWNSSYLRYLLSLKGEDFSQSGEFAYDQEQLSAFLETQKEWLDKNAGEQEQLFSQKYRYVPDIQLLRQGRIDFICLTLTEYLSLQESLRSGLQFSYLSHNSRIRPEAEVYAGIITEKKDRQEKSAAVIETFISSRFQEDYLEWKQSIKNESFGFLGGISSQMTINQKFFPLNYRELDSRIFQKEQLLPVLNTPPYWSFMAEPVVDIWLKLSLSEDENENLMDFYKEWDLQFIP